MFRNYLKVAFRYLARHKEYTAINILGLAVGITCCVLIMLFVRSELSYDAFHSKSDRLYRMWQHEKYQGEDFINTSTPLPMAQALQSNFAEIESTCRVFSFNPIVKVSQQSFTEDVRMVDSSFFRLFDFKLIEGDRNNPFPTRNSILLTPAIAKKYFGKENPVGKNIEMQIGSDTTLFSVAGIVQPAPEASSIKFNALISYANSKSLFSERSHRSWFNVYNETYVLLKENIKADALQKKFPAMMKQQLGEDYKENGFLLFLQPITNIHLNNTLPEGIEPISNPKYSYILATIGILILLVACINFITLSIGRSTTRAMEVGVRKALGAARKQLIRQFWGEAFIVTIIAVIIGLSLSALLIKPFNQLTSKNLSLSFDAGFILFCLLMIGLIALIAGMYPAFVLSRFNPVEVLKGKLKFTSNKGWLRQSLIVGQFIASIGMIVCTISIGEQMRYLRTKDLGYNKEQVVVVPTNKGRREGFPLAQLYRTELLKNPQVADVAISIYSFAETPWVQMGFTDDRKVYKSFQYNTVDENFLRAMNIQVARGRGFQAGTADFTTAAVVNEAFVKEFNLGDAIGKKLPGKFDEYIIGVVKDFNFESLHTRVNPLVMTMRIDSIARRSENINISSPPQPRISVRMKGGNLADNIDILKQAWMKVNPSQDFVYQFLDEQIASRYAQEQRASTIVKLASALSIFIACMGLFGLATLTVVRRTKEIGIRKVLGASIPTIAGLLSKDFVKLVVIAAVIAFPLAWWAMNSWLQDFAYRVSIGWWVYALAGVLAVLVALITVSYQAIRAAMSNPVKSLRTE